MVKHFAGPVVYDSQHFLDKNRDVIRQDIVRILRTSSNSLLHAMLHTIRVDGDVEKVDDGSAGRRGVGGGGGGGAGKNAKTQTLGAEFRKQLEELMHNISTTSPHYVRCIKPNSLNKGGLLDPALVVGQLRCGGVLEAVRVSRAGFPNRFTFAEFLKRYNCLSHSRSRGSGKVKSSLSTFSSSPLSSSSEAQTKERVQALCDEFAERIVSSPGNVPHLEAGRVDISYSIDCEIKLYGNGCSGDDGDNSCHDSLS